MTVYSFYNEEVEKADKEFTSLFFSFKNEQELANLLENNARADNGEKKKEFFKKKYGVVDGKEVERYIAFRKWNEKSEFSLFHDYFFPFRFSPLSSFYHDTVSFFFKIWLYFFMFHIIHTFFVTF